MPTLVSISYSPWSIRTRLALAAMGTAVQHRDYLPGLSEPRLRAELRRWTGRVTVPVLLLDDGTVLDDSLDIVLWASGRTARPLVPADRATDVRHWNGVADRMLAVGRLRTTRRVLEAPAALQASLPRPLDSLGPLGSAVGRLAARQLLRKYAGSSDLEALRAGTETLRAGLTHGARRSVRTTDRLLGSTLTYADLTCAVGLSFVRPHPQHPLAEAARDCWTEAALLDTVGDLLAWRDAVLEAVSTSA